MSDVYIAATLRDQVYGIIKKRIIDQYYKPGQWLQENEVASQLKVSRSPVRSALKTLVHDGLVVELPNKGVFVREFSPEDIREIFDMRNMLESYAIKGSRGKLREQAIGNLNELSERLAEAHARGDLDGYIACDARLHETIIELGGNALLSKTYSQLQTMLHPFRVFSLRESGRFDASVEEHRAIVRHILSGDTEQAIAVNMRHLTLARDVILENLPAAEK